MRKLISSMMMLVLLLGTALTSKAQTKSYKMWETITITPDNTKLKVLQENIRKHNKTFHKKGPYKSSVYDIVSGPNSNKILWEMGPLTFSHFDSRPADDKHTNDWRDNVMPYVKELSNNEYWRKEEKFSHTEGLSEGSHPINLVRHFTIADGEDYNSEALLTQIVNTIKSMPDANPFGVYENLLTQGAKGNHFITINFLKKWADLDKEDTFEQAFIKLHGKKSWDPFIKNWNEAYLDAWDEIQVYNPKMSGDK